MFFSKASNDLVPAKTVLPKFEGFVKSSTAIKLLRIFFT